MRLRNVSCLLEDSTNQPLQKKVENQQYVESWDHTEFRVLALQLPHSEQMNPDGVHQAAENDKNDREEFMPTLLSC